MKTKALRQNKPSISTHTLGVAIWSKMLDPPIQCQGCDPMSTAPAHQPALIQSQGLVLLQLLPTGGPQLKGQPVIL